MKATILSLVALTLAAPPRAHPEHEEMPCALSGC